MRNELSSLSESPLALSLSSLHAADMSVFHDEVEIEDFEYDEDSETFFYPCPCGDKFAITKEELENGEDVATCPSCSLIVRVIYDLVSSQQQILFQCNIEQFCLL